MRYCDSPFLYRRRRTREVTIGDLVRNTGNSQEELAVFAPQIRVHLG